MTQYLFNYQASRDEFIKATFEPSTCISNVESAINYVNYMLNSNGSYVHTQHHTVNLVLTGPVGIGKSTLCTLLYYLIDRKYNPKSYTDVYCYPDFLQVDRNEGRKKLESMFTGDLSTFAFQSHILDCWDAMMTNQPRKSYARKPIDPRHGKFVKDHPTSCRLNIFERCCDDSVLCFANLMRHRTPPSMSDVEFTRLFSECLALDKFYGIPSYFDQRRAAYDPSDPNVIVPWHNDIIFYTLQPAPLYELAENVVRIIDERINISDERVDLTNNADYTFAQPSLKDPEITIYIGLQSDLNTLVERVQRRNRLGETNYTLQNILEFYNHYEIMYEYLRRSGSIRNTLLMKRLVEYSYDLHKLIQVDGIYEQGDHARNGYESYSEDEEFDESDLNMVNPNIGNATNTDDVIMNHANEVTYYYNGDDEFD